MHSIGSAHAEVRSRRRETSLASTTDRILLINGSARSFMRTLFHCTNQRAEMREVDAAAHWVRRTPGGQGSGSASEYGSPLYLLLSLVSGQLFLDTLQEVCAVGI